MTRSGSLKSVRTCLDIVETLTESNGCGVSELAEKMDMPKSTAFEYLRTLKEEGYLLKEDGEYKCSTRFLSLGDRIRSNVEVYRVAQPELDSLSSETEAHASLVREENGFGAVLCIENTDHRMTPIVHLGQPTRLHANASGKAILSSLPEERVEEILDRRELVALTDKTITDRETLWEELDKIQERGYAIDIGEAMEGVGGIAVPIMDRATEKPIAGIALYGPASGNEIDVPEEEFLEDLQRTKNTIEVNLLRR